VALSESLDRVLAEDVIASINVPPADNSAMDGYAVRYADCIGLEEPLPVSQRIAAADTVIMQEHCEAGDNSVSIVRKPFQGANIRPAAQDIQAGDKILSGGQRLRAQDLGLIASLGIAEIPCYRRLKVAVISTGSELVEPGEEVKPGQIYNSNRYMINGMLEKWGCEPLDLGIVPDDPAAVRELLLKASSDADMIVTSGGVSVGEEDHVKNEVEALGAIDLWKVSIKPGKPFAFGHVAGTPFVGLPGNPGSVWVTLLVLARPYILHCAGRREYTVHPISLAAQFEHRGSLRQEYLRAKSVPTGVDIYPKQSSGVLMSASWGDGLVIQYQEQDIIRGDNVDFLPYSLLE
jgi:molybdopterin molybdotransferase